MLGVTIGAAVRVSTRAEASESAPATVSGVAGEIDRQRRVAVMEAVLDPPPPGWLPGMYAEVAVDRRTLRDALIVPAGAVLSRLRETGEVDSGVFVAEGAQARWRPVTVTARDGDRVAVAVSGGALPAGARVLVAGHVDLVDGSPITIATAPAAPAGGTPTAASAPPAAAPAAAEGPR